MGNQHTKFHVRTRGASINSVMYRRRQDIGQLNKYLTTRQIQIIQDSWKVIKNDLIFVGRTTFEHFFKSDQDLKAYFPKIIRISENNELEWDVDRDMLQRHGLTVMRGLEAAVESLEDSQFLNGILFRIGEAHVYKNIKPQMLKRLWPSLNYSFKQVLKDSYNKEIAEAWRLTYQYICSHMKSGMESSLKR